MSLTSDNSSFTKGEKKMTLSQKLVILRKTKGITQDELARALEVSRQSVHKWESGQCYPEVPKIIKMKEIFEISFDELLDEKIEVALPEKKKRRSVKKDERNETSFENREIADEEIKEEISKLEVEVAAPISAEPVIEEISVEVINEKKIAEEPKEEKKEEISKPEEKKKGFFGKIFGRK